MSVNKFDHLWPSEVMKDVCMPFAKDTNPALIAVEFKALIYLEDLGAQWRPSTWTTHIPDPSFDKAHSWHRMLLWLQAVGNLYNNVSV